MRVIEETSSAGRWTVNMLALILLLAMHLVFDSPGGSGVDLPQAQLVWCFIALLMAGCAWCMGHQALQLTSFARILLVGAVMLTLPVLWSPSRDWQLDSLPRLTGLWAGVTLYILLLNCRFSASQKQGVLWLIVIAAMMQTAYSLAGLWCPSLLPKAGQIAVKLNPEMGVGVFQQRNVTASFIATGAAALLWLVGDNRFALGTSRGEKYRLAAISAALVILYMTLTVLKSRTGWLGGIASWCLFIPLFSAVKTPESALARWAVRLAPALGIALGILAMSGDIAGALHEHDGSNLERMFILHQTWRMIMQYPFVGWGYGGFCWYFIHSLADHGLPISQGMNHLTYPHNELLFWWLEGGIVALAGLMVVLVGGCVLFFRRIDRTKLAVLGCLLPILLHTQLEYPLYQSPVHWLLFILLLSFADALTTNENQYRDIFTRPSVKIIPCLIATLACCGVFLLAMTFCQGRTLTAFQQSPATYANRVLHLHETGIGTERLRKERALSYILRYQQKGDIADLYTFNEQGRRWIQTWNDADIYNNLINVEDYLGQYTQAIIMKNEAHRLYPNDARFI